MTSTTFLVRLLAAAALLAAALAATLVIQAPEAQSQSSTDGPGQSYAVLDRPAKAEDDISSWRLPDLPHIGLRPAAARVVASDARRTVAAVPAAKSPCLVTRSAGGGRAVSCAPRHGEPTASVTYNGAIGLVPNSVRTVTFKMADGSTQVKDVVENVWESPIEAASASFVYKGRTVKIDLLPRSSLPEGATITSDGVVMMGEAPAGFSG